LNEVNPITSQLGYARAVTNYRQKFICGGSQEKPDRIGHMAWGINLRNDLARLSDSELAEELDRLCEYRSSRFGSAPAVGSLRGFFRYHFAWPLFGRGPVHARWAYRFWIGYYWIFRGPVGTQYLVECEIKDLRDELQRREKRKNANIN
jgi:hypothetical protein